MAASATESPSVTERPLTGGLVSLLAGLAAIGALATNIILPSFPQMAADLGVSAKDLGLLLSSFFVAFAFGQLVVGPLSDRFGRAKLVLGGLAVFAAGSILCAVATTFPVMVTGRVIQAIGACTASVLARAIGRDLFEGAALGRALALTMIASAAAPGFSPLLGSLLVTLSHWRVTFVVVAAFSVALGIHYARRIGETHGADRRTPLAPLAVAKAYGHLLADRRFLLPAVAVGVIIGGLYSFFAAAPSILMVELGLTALQLGSPSPSRCSSSSSPAFSRRASRTGGAAMRSRWSGSWSPSSAALRCSSLPQHQPSPPSPWRSWCSCSASA